jgi:hypothetical protein
MRADDAGVSIAPQWALRPRILPRAFEYRRGGVGVVLSEAKDLAVFGQRRRQE